MDLLTSIHNDMSQLLIPQLFHCSICCHDLHDIIRLFHSDNVEGNFFKYPTDCIRIANLLVSKMCNYVISRYMLWPISPFLDEGMGKTSPSSSIRSSPAGHRTLNQERRSSLFHEQALTNEEVSQLWIPAHQTHSSQDGPDDPFPLRDLLAR